MTREEFTGGFLGLMIKKIPSWLPEEAPEEMMLDIMMKRILEHEVLIREVLINGNS